MSLDPLSAAFELGKSAIERIWPDPIRRAEELRKLEELHQQGDLAELDAHVQLMLGQLRVNEAEAKHKSLFVAGWRPFVGWVGAMSLAYSGLLHPLLMWGWKVAEAMGNIPTGVEPPPIIETGILGTILSGMLGIGMMRSHDKRHGVQTDKLGGQ